MAACAHNAESAATSGPTPVATAAVRVATARPVVAKRIVARAAIAVPARPTPSRHATDKPTLPPVRAAQTVHAASARWKAAQASARPVRLAAISEDSTGPKIISVATTPTVVHTGETVTWNVRTSPDVVSVTAHVSAYTFPLQRRGPGRFFLGFTIPSNVPPIFHGTYNLEMTARAQGGSSATRNVPMIFQ